eukprot:6490395-Amphidinium_carterae.1
MTRRSNPCSTSTRKTYENDEYDGEKDRKIDEDNRKKEDYRKQIRREEDEKQKKRDQEREQQAAGAAAASSARTTLPFRLTGTNMEPPRPIRPAPTPQRELDEMEKNKKTIPKTPSLPAISPRLRLDSKNFKNDETQRPDSYYEKMLFQELMQRSYITHHPTSGYSKATKEIKRVYDGFELNNYTRRGNDYQINSPKLKS